MSSNEFKISTYLMPLQLKLEEPLSNIKDWIKAQDCGRQSSAKLRDVDLSVIL